MVWKAKNLPENKHCFLGRNGGVSSGKYQSLNVNTKSLDDWQNLNQNLEIAAQSVSLKKENLLLLNQGVSNIATYVDQASCDVVTADGIVTDVSGIGLCIRTADCAPILLRDDKAGVVGAAHAGWRGAFGGIIENVVSLMLKKGASKANIAAAVGPCIAQNSYEVDADFYARFVACDKKFTKYFINGVKKGFYLFDLAGFCADKLLLSGIENIEVAHHDTYKREDEYFSYRRLTHRQQIEQPKDFATELSIIVL